MRDRWTCALWLALLTASGCGDTPPGARPADGASTPETPRRETDALRGSAAPAPQASIDVGRLRVAITAEGVLVFGDAGSLPPGLALRVTNLETRQSVEARTTAEGGLETVIPGGVSDAIELLPLGSPESEAAQLASVQEAEAARGPCNCSSLSFHPDATDLATVYSPFECWEQSRDFREDPGASAFVAAACSATRGGGLLRTEGCGMMRLSSLTAGYVVIDRTYDPASGVLLGVSHASDTAHGYCAVGPARAWYGVTYHYGQVLIPGETCNDVTHCVPCGPATSDHPACP